MQLYPEVLGLFGCTILSVKSVLLLNLADFPMVTKK